MSDFPRNLIVPTHINSWTRYMIGPAIRQLQTFSSPAAFDWTANVAIYLPLYLPWPYNVRRVMWTAGNVVTGGNFDLGIYSAGGGRLWSAGSTTIVGSSTGMPNYVAPSPDILLAPGSYWLAWACDTGGAASSRAYGFIANAAQGRQYGAYQQSVFPLPATPTFAAYNGVGIPLIGITNTPSGF